jgi:hypothetical protein
MQCVSLKNSLLHLSHVFPAPFRKSTRRVNWYPDAHTKSAVCSWVALDTAAQDLGILTS